MADRIFFGMCLTFCGIDMNKFSFFFIARQCTVSFFNKILLGSYNYISIKEFFVCFT